jgi:mRNA interferase MazF
MARGEIWAVDIPAPKGKPGREQLGMCPGIVVQADTADPRLPTTIVIPATSKKEAQRFPYTIMVEPSAQNGLDKPTVLLAFQIRAIDKNRLIRKLGRLEDDHLKNLEMKIRSLLAI